MASGTWGTGYWGQNQFGDNANVNVDVTNPNDLTWGEGAYGEGNYGGTDDNLSASIGSVTVTAEINAGWGRLEWGNGVWGDAYSVQLSGISLSSNLGSLTISTDVGVNVTGQPLNLNQGDESITTDVGVDVTGQLLSTNLGDAELLRLQGFGLASNLGTVDIQAGGNIFVNAGPESEIEINL